MENHEEVSNNDEKVDDTSLTTNSNNYKCEECGKDYKMKRSLISHTKSKCGTLNPYKCNVCNKELKTAASLHTHTIRHEGSRNFMCRFCAKLFVTLGQLEIHERVHTQDKPFVCEVCGKSFRHRQSLVTHSTLHTGIKPFNCGNCKRSFSCVGNLLKHRHTHAECARLPLTTHTIQNPLTKLKLQANTPKNCKLKHFLKEKVEGSKKEGQILRKPKIKKPKPIGGRNGKRSTVDEKQQKSPVESFRGNSECALEQLSNSNDKIDDNKNYSTYTEDNVNKPNNSLKLTNMASENDSENAPQEIVDTSSTTLMKAENIQNKVIKNNNTDSRTCNRCKTNFLNKEEYEQHQRKEHPEMLTCSSCDKMYSTEYSLKVHKKTFHMGIPRKVYRYICPQCGKQFNQKSSLMAHEKNKCDTTLTFRCEVCNKSFGTAHSQKAHMRVHSTKKFLCNYCGKRFHWKTQLKIHERSHTGDKPFSCLYCPKVFAYRESLITHSSIHTGIKPHLCEACGSRFSCIGNLIKHRITHVSTCGPYKTRPES